MDGHSFGLIELLLVFGIVIVWALWEIKSTPRSGEHGAEADTADAPRKTDPSD